MNPSLLVPLLLSACQAPAAASVSAPVHAIDARSAIDAGSAIEQGEVEARVYDLTPLALRASGDQITDLVWPVFGRWLDEEPQEWGVEPDDEAPASLLRLLFAREFEYEGNAIEYLGDGRFAVIGPAGLHERIARALPELAAFLNATIELELDLVRLDHAPTATQSVVPEAQVAALIEQAEREGRLVRRRLAVSSARPEASVQGHWVDVLADYDCEVAQGSYVWDPYVLKAYLGTRLALRAAPGAGGVYVALTLRRTTAAGELDERRLTRTARMSNERDMRVDEIDLLHQRLPILDRALALNTFLPDGQALILAASQGSAGAHELLIVRRIGGGLPRTKRLGSGSGAGGMLLIDSSGWSPPYAESSWDELGSARLPMDPLRNGVSLWVSLNGPREQGMPVEDLLFNFPGVTGAEPGDLEVWEPWLAVSPSEDGSLPDVERAVGGFAPDQRLVQVSLALRSSGLDAPVASLTLPLRVGLTSAVVLGVEDTYVGDADVEIAQDSSIEDPILFSLFDGLTLELSPRLGLDGALVLGLRGQASARDGAPRKVDLGGGAVGEIEVASQRFLIVTEELRFPAGGGASRAVVGDLAGGLSLEVEARF